MSIGSGPGRRSAMTAGDRKIPEPMVVPTRTAMALHSPSWRGSSRAVVEFVVSAIVAHMVLPGQHERTFLLTIRHNRRTGGAILWRSLIVVGFTSRHVA